MRPLLLLFVFFSLFHLHTWAQSDVLVFKKKSQNIQSWVKDDFIHFQYVTTQWLDGKIKRIANDSIFVNCYITRQVANQFGFPTIDTSWYGVMGVHVSEIIGMPGNRYKSGMFTNGSLLKLGSAGYIFLNLFNSLEKGEALFASNNLRNIGIAAGVFLLGHLQSLKYKSYIRMGKKYSMQIISGQKG
jgi:hypothetical protein